MSDTPNYDAGYANGRRDALAEILEALRLPFHARAEGVTHSEWNALAFAADHIEQTLALDAKGR